MLDSMAPVFVMRLRTRVKTYRNRCEFKLVTKTKIQDVFEARDNLYRKSVFSTPAKIAGPDKLGTDSMANDGLKI